jgi:hypothetical protein
LMELSPSKIPIGAPGATYDRNRQDAKTRPQTPWICPLVNTLGFTPIWKALRYQQPNLLVTDLMSAKVRFYSSHLFANHPSITNAMWRESIRAWSTFLAYASRY